MKLLNVEKQDNIEFYLSCKFQPSTFNVRCKTDVTDGMPDKQTNERTTVCRGSAPRHNNSKSSVLDFEDCGKLGKVFESALLYQYNNLFQLDRVFNPPSKIYPLIVKVNYSIDLTMHDPDSGCSKFNWPNTTEVLVLHWTSKSLYKNFGSTVINQIPLQAPYLVLYYLEHFSNLESEPYVDDFLWAGEEARIPEVNLNLSKIDINIQNLNENIRGYQHMYHHTLGLSRCPSDKIVRCALEELNQWVSE